MKRIQTWLRTLFWRVATTNNNKNDLKTMTFTAIMPSTSDVCANFYNQENVFTWQAKDWLIVVGYNESDKRLGQNLFFINPEDSNKIQGRFTGLEIPGAVKYDVFYNPYRVSLNPDKNFVLSFETQEQNGNDSMLHLRNSCYMCAKGVNDLKTVSLKRKSCIMKFELRNISPKIGRLTKLTWTVETEDGTKSIALTFPVAGNKRVEFSNESENSLIAYLGFPPEEVKAKPLGKFSIVIQGTGRSVFRATKIVAGRDTYKEGRQYITKIDGTSETMIWEELQPSNTSLSQDFASDENVFEQPTFISKATESGKSFLLKRTLPPCSFLNTAFFRNSNSFYPQSYISVYDAGVG